MPKEKRTLISVAGISRMLITCQKCGWEITANLDNEQSVMKLIPRECPKCGLWWDNNDTIRYELRSIFTQLREIKMIDRNTRCAVKLEIIGAE